MGPFRRNRDVGTAKRSGRVVSSLVSQDSAGNRPRKATTKENEAVRSTEDALVTTTPLKSRGAKKPPLSPMTTPNTRDRTNPCIVSPSPRRLAAGVRSSSLHLQSSSKELDQVLEAAVIKSRSRTITPCRRVVQDLQSAPSFASSLSAGDTDTTYTRQSLLSHFNDGDEPSLNTMRAGNVTNSDTSSALSSLVCLSLISQRRPPPRSTTSDSRTSASAFSSSATPAEIIVQQSLTRHMRFHLARVNRCANRDEDSIESSLESSFGSQEEWSEEDSSVYSTSSESSAEDHPNLDPHEVHYLAQECLNKGDMAQAMVIYKQLLQKQRKNVHAQRGDTLSRLSVLCLLSGGKKNNKRAQSYSNEALNLHDGDHPSLQSAVATMELGLVHFGANRLSKALQLWRQAMQMSCVAMGYDHPHVAILLNNIGVLHFKTGDYAGSLRALEESVELQRTSLKFYCSPINVENAIHQLALTMSNLGIVYEEGRQQYDRALGFVQESVALYESVFTFERDRMGDILTEYMERLERLRAENTGDQTTSDQSAKVAVLDRSHTARSTELFGNSDGIPNKLSYDAFENDDFLLLGPLREAWTAENRVRQTVLAWFGKKEGADEKLAAFVSFDKNLRDNTRSKRSIPVDLDGEHVVNAELHLKAIHTQVMEHVERGQIEDALDIFRGALRSHQEKYGEIHHLVGSTLHNMGMVYLYAQQYVHAQAAFVEAMNVRSAALGSNHIDVSSSKMKIGLIQLAKSDLARACDTFWDIRDCYLDTLGYGHPLLAKIMNNIGVVAISHGDWSEAFSSFELAHQYLSRHREEATETPAMAIAMAHTLSNIGFVSYRMGTRLRAIEFYQRALKIYKEHECVPDYIVPNIQFLRDEESAGCQVLVSPLCFTFA